MVGDFLDASWRHAPAAKNVRKERPDVGRRLRTAERDHQHRIEWLGHVLAAIILGRDVPPVLPARLNLPRPVWLLGWVSLVTDMATEMIYPLLPLFLTRVLGASAMSLGVIEGMAEAANSALKIAAGRVADRTGAPKKIVLVGYGLSGAVRPLIGFATSWTLVLGLRVTDRLGKGIRGAPRDAMLAHFTPPDIRGRAFGFHRAMDHAGAVAGPLIASAFLYFRPDDYRTLFALTIVPGIAVILILLRVPDARTPPPAEQPQARHESTALSRRFYRAIVVIVVFSFGNASDAFLLLRMNDLGIAAVWIPLLWSALHVVKVASSVVGGDLSDRLGRRLLIGLGWLVYAVVYAGFAFVDSAAAVVAIFLSYGLYFGLTEGVEKAWVADLAPATARGTAFGVYNAALGVGALCASVMFGAIWTRVSPQAAFLTGAALALLATGLLYFFFPDDKNSRHER
jgi:MFS family permease